MNTDDIILEIEKLPVENRLYIIERAMKSILVNESKSGMEYAAEALLEDYQTDKELIAFTDLDCEKFYESR